MGGIDVVAAGCCERRKHLERIGRGEMEIAADEVDLPALGEEPEIGIADRGGEALEGGVAMLLGPPRAEGHQPRFDMLGKGALRDGMMDEPSPQVAFLDAAPGPVDHLGGEDRPDSHLRAEAEEANIHAGGVDVGQLGEIADPHHHRCLGVAFADVEIAAEARSEAEANRLEDRIEAVGDAVAVEPTDRGIKAFKRGGHVGDRHHLAAPVGGVLGVRGIDREDERRPGFHGCGNFTSVKAVDRDGVTIVNELLHDVGHAAPAPFRIAAQVDPIGAIGAHPPGFGEDRGGGHPRGVVDLGDDLDRMAAVVGQIGALLAEVFIEPPQILRAPFDRGGADGPDHIERAAGGPGEDHPVGSLRHLESLGDPGGGHEGGNGDVHHLDGRDEADAWREPLEHLAQRRLREPAGDEVKAGTLRRGAAFGGGGHGRSTGEGAERSHHSIAATIPRSLWGNCRPARRTRSRVRRTRENRRFSQWTGSPGYPAASWLRDDFFHGQLGGAGQFPFPPAGR